MREIIKKLEERIDLDNQIMTDAVNQIMSGEVEDPMIEDFLIKKYPELCKDLSLKENVINV